MRGRRCGRQPGFWRQGAKFSILLVFQLIRRGSPSDDGTLFRAWRCRRFAELKPLMNFNFRFESSPRLDATMTVSMQPSNSMPSSETSRETYSTAPGSMSPFQSVRRGWVAGIACGCGVALLIAMVSFSGDHGLATTASAQEKEKSPRKADKKKKAAVPTTQIDVKAGELSDNFVKEAQALAGEYYEAGALDKSKALLEAVLKLKPGTKEVELQIKKIDEDVLSSNELEVDVNAAKGWEWSGVNVLEDKPFRIQAEGVYRFMVNTTVGPAGFTEKDKELTTEMVSRAPCGALVGVVLKDDGKQGQPFFIGNGGDFRVKESGKLFLRVNSPPDSKHNGKISVKFSGFVLKQGK